MATILSAYDRGHLYGRCDASCYDGAKTQCNCICGGANHGIGIEAALANTAEMSAEWLKRDRSQRRSRSVEFVAPLVTQPKLF